MNRKKCPQCGLVNAANDERCRRCEALLEGVPDEIVATPDGVRKRRSLGKRLAWIVSTTLFLLFVFYMSLRVSSEDLGYDDRQIVLRSVAILDQQGFGREATLLRNFTTYRSSDNWWNRYLGHREAYAATNFPFEVLTLYPQFFTESIDDNERAVILLHESCHLLGSGEEAALEQVWRNKRRLGWTEDKYGESRVWRSTKLLTMNLLPQLFQCGPDGKSDCAP